MRFRAPGCQDCFKAGCVKSWSGEVWPPCQNPDLNHAGQWEENTCPGGGTPATITYKAPLNVGDKFYKTLRKLGYAKGPEGDYR